MPDSLLLVVSLVLLLVAIALLWRGVWPRRLGNDPHCRHCGYNLTGLAPGNCPECGNAWTANSVLVGERTRRPKFILAGIVCAAVSLPVLGVLGYRFAESVDLYQLKPTFLLLRDMKSSDWITAGRALGQMERRIGTWRVTQEELERFVTIVFPCRLRVRPRCIASEGVPYQLRMEAADLWVAEAVPGLPGAYSRSPLLGIEPRVLTYRCWWDDAPPEAWPFPNMGSTTMPMCVDGRANLPSGRHTLHYQMRVAYLRRNPLDGRNETILEQEILREASCEVLEAEPQDYIKVNYDPRVGEAFQRAIASAELSQISSTFAGVGGGTRASGTLEFGIGLAGPVPEDAAFEVVVLVEGKEYLIGEVICRKGQTQWQDQKTFYGSYNGPRAASADVILRGSLRVARNAVEMIDPWAGQVVIPGVRIKSLP